MRKLSSTIILLAYFLLLSQSFSAARDNRPGKNAILLSKVKTLTLHGNRATTSRRVAPIPQLKCTGPSQRICELYPIESMRCTNQGYGYDEEDIQWTCEANLPSELKLGSTDVICEGYRNADDKWVLKGSCGVEYRLLLTDAGERKFGHLQKSDKNMVERLWTSLGNFAFYVIFCVALAFILFCAFNNFFGNNGQRRNNRGNSGWPWGGDPFDDPRGPPPPYEPYPRRPNPKPSYSYDSRQTNSWSPGFWTGALTGAAAGYGFGRRSQGQESLQRNTSSWGRRGYNNGEGSSRSPPSFSSTRQSTGFGSTRRR